jgi:hypothetical protein
MDVVFDDTFHGGYGAAFNGGLEEVIADDQNEHE